MIAHSLAWTARCAIATDDPGGAHVSRRDTHRSMRASRKRRKRRTSEGLTGRGNISSHTEIATIMKSKTFHASQKKRSPYLRVHATGHVSHMGKKGASCDALPTILFVCTAVPRWAIGGAKQGSTYAISFTTTSTVNRIWGERLSSGEREAVKLAKVRHRGEVPVLHGETNNCAVLFRNPYRQSQMIRTHELVLSWGIHLENLSSFRSCPQSEAVKK